MVERICASTTQRFITHHTRPQTPLRCSRTLLTVAMLCCATRGTNRLVAISVAPPREHTPHGRNALLRHPWNIPFLTVAMLCCATRGSLTRPQSSLRCPPTSFIVAILNCVTLVNTFSQTQPTGAPLLANNRGRNPQLRRPSLLSAVAVYAAPSANNNIHLFHLLRCRSVGDGLQPLLDGQTRSISRW